MPDSVFVILWAASLFCGRDKSDKSDEAFAGSCIVDDVPGFSETGSEPSCASEISEVPGSVAVDIDAVFSAADEESSAANVWNNSPVSKEHTIRILKDSYGDEMQTRKVKEDSLKKQA